MFLLVLRDRRWLLEAEAEVEDVDTDVVASQREDVVVEIRVHNIVFNVKETIIPDNYWDKFSTPKKAHVVDSMTTLVATSSPATPSVHISQENYNHFLQFQAA